MSKLTEPSGGEAPKHWHLLPHITSEGENWLKKKSLHNIVCHYRVRLTLPLLS